MGVLNRFNWISPFYDTLTRVVFMGRLQRAQLEFLNSVHANSNVLVLGGGTGWILEELLRVCPSCRVTYIEASSSMLSRSQKRLRHINQNVIFINGTEDNIPVESVFDVVITNFFLDVFTADTLNTVITKIGLRLRSGGYWLVCDFVKTHVWWQAIMLKLMYGFFRVTCGIEARSLPEWVRCLEYAGLIEKKSAWFFRRFIRSVVFAKEA